MENVKPRPVLADCPYCAGSGTDALAWDRRCERCNGRGRMARFVVDEIVARWAADGWPGDGRDGLAGGKKSGSAEGDGKSMGNGEGGGHGDDHDPEPPRPYRFRPAA